MIATLGLLIILALGGLTLAILAREPGRKARRKDLKAARSTINGIDDIVDRYQPQLDLVGRAMTEEIRKLISQHRKETNQR